MCTYYHIGDHLVEALVVKPSCVKVCTYYHIGDHLVQALVLRCVPSVQALLRCVLITTLVTIWYKPSC